MCVVVSLLTLLLACGLMVLVVLEPLLALLDGLLAGEEQAAAVQEIQMELDSTVVVLSGVVQVEVAEGA
ncbi:hypothetical protein LCGC14_2360200 [marine sediment metagenome]|uniref:Uncharacterized protein n=1 Tax=marine sediment metagenome TaxID=412755 RepID=A0A0F9C6P2_9ZZZZ